MLGEQLGENVIAVQCPIGVVFSFISDLVYFNSAYGNLLTA